MIKAIDLFAGAGGLSYGFIQTGEYEFVAAAEINENARKTYKRNIVKDNKNFEFIENVIGYDFNKLNELYNNQIDVVIGGPPCQGFSNANRQKNHLISLNNSLVKEYFRAIKQIKPKAFVMENVSMLSSDIHRFYESNKDKDEINVLIEQGFDIPKRKDKLIITNETFDDIDVSNLSYNDLNNLKLPSELAHLLSVLRKNIHNKNRLPNFISKNSKNIIKKIDILSFSDNDKVTYINKILYEKLISIKDGLLKNEIETKMSELDFIVKFQKTVEYIQEIKENELIGNFEISDSGELYFNVNSYSVIDYINAILGNMYVQKGNIVKSEYFGVPQERRRYIIIGIRKDIYDQKGFDIKFPEEKTKHIVTVSEAISDLIPYKVGYTSDFPSQSYLKQENMSQFAKKMRKGSNSVKNQITTKTTDKALSRFKKIKPGFNFHSLDISDKDTYTKPERTQNTIYLRLDPNKPSGTVVNVRKSMWIHPSLDRAITVREAARLQSFSDSFEFIGSKDSQYQQVGNAVPPLLAKEIAKILLTYLK